MANSKKSTLTIEEVKHVAKLANLSISESELPKFQEQLSNILDLFTKLKSIPTENVKPTYQVTGEENKLRDDVVDAQRMFTQDQALSNAKRKHNGFFVIKAIFE